MGYMQMQRDNKVERRGRGELIPICMARAPRKPRGCEPLRLGRANQHCSRCVGPHFLSSSSLPIARPTAFSDVGAGKWSAAAPLAQSCVTNGARSAAERQSSLHNSNPSRLLFDVPDVLLHPDRLGPRSSPYQDGISIISPPRTTLAARTSLGAHTLAIFPSNAFIIRPR